VVIMLSILDACTRRARYRAMERQHGLERASVKKRKEAAMQHATESIFMLMGQGSAPASRSWSVRILFICWAGAFRCLVGRFCFLKLKL